MKRKQAPSSSGESAPMWVVSFADMVALLMAFFVMLASFSAGSSSDVKFRSLLRSFQEAFGSDSGLDGPGAGGDPAELMARLDRIILKHFKRADSGGGKPGMPGRDNTVTRIREGIEFTIGGQIGFHPGSAELREEAKEAIRELNEYIRGENTKIEIRGHTTRFEVGPDKPFADEHQLGFARVCAVAEYMISLGIRPERIRRVDCGSSEPLVVRAYDDQTKAANRRVEIIVTQALVQEFQGSEESNTSAGQGKSGPD